MRVMIASCAERLFDIYYRHTVSQSLQELQSLTEEAYKLHERLCKGIPGSNGLLDLNEFILLKALRNYSVHQGDFIGEAFGINRSFAQQLNLDLARVCLIKKGTVKKAINYEPPLRFGEDEKMIKIEGQLVDFGDFYNIEPVIYNFMVKVYEKLIYLNFHARGKGFLEIDQAYKKETYYNYSHYVSLKFADVSIELVAKNIVPISKLNLDCSTGLIDPCYDPFVEIEEIKVDCSKLTVAEYVGSEYAHMRSVLIKKIVQDSALLAAAIRLPKHLGLAFLGANKNSVGEILFFNVGKQKNNFNARKIVLDSKFYQVTVDELLVLFFHESCIYPVILHKAVLSGSCSAAEQGYADAQFELGLIYAEGQGVIQNDVIAVSWYRKAAEQGYSPAQFNLGLMFAEGQGVAQDYIQAVHWFRKAADQGDADAQFKLGLMYFQGQCVLQNDSQAVGWFYKAAEQGYSFAQCNLGMMYAEGQGVAQDNAQAVYWYQKAADQGDADAQFNLGLMYVHGQGVLQNDSQAVDWFCKAAEQGYSLAQYNLGVIYADGQGVQQDWVIAYALFNLDSTPSGLENIAFAASEMLPNQIEAGQRLACEISKPNNLSKAIGDYLRAPVVASNESEMKGVEGEDWFSIVTDNKGTKLCFQYPIASS